MNKSIQHLRGTQSDWNSYDIVVPDGELALLRTADGSYKIKVGDGSRTFSELVSISGDTDISADSDITLRSGVSFRRGELLALILRPPAIYGDGFYSEVSFDSGNKPTEFSDIGCNIRFTGDGTADGEFIAEPDTHYTIFIWYDGQMQGVIRGIPNA